MTRSIAATLAGAALVALAACGRPDDVNTDTTGAMATPPAVPPVGMSVGATTGATTAVDTLSRQP